MRWPAAAARWLQPPTRFTGSAPPAPRRLLTPPPPPPPRTIRVQPWLVGRPGQELRSYRCVTTANAEVEPWMFAFTVD